MREILQYTPGLCNWICLDKRAEGSEFQGHASPRFLGFPFLEIARCTPPGAGKLARAPGEDFTQPGDGNGLFGLFDGRLKQLKPRYSDSGGFGIIRQNQITKMP